MPEGTVSQTEVGFHKKPDEVAMLQIPKPSTKPFFFADMQESDAQNPMELAAIQNLRTKPDENVQRQIAQRMFGNKNALTENVITYVRREGGEAMRTLSEAVRSIQPAYKTRFNRVGNIPKIFDQARREPLGQEMGELARSSLYPPDTVSTVTAKTFQSLVDFYPDAASFDHLFHIFALQHAATTDRETKMKYETAAAALGKMLYGKQWDAYQQELLLHKAAGRKPVM